MSTTTTTTNTTQVKLSADLAFLKTLADGLPLNPLPPPCTARDPNVPHAPNRPLKLTKEEKKVAIRNALRYFPKELHKLLGKEFLEELEQYGHIYMYRFRPTYEIKAYPIDAYPAKTAQGRAIMLMIMNNLDKRVAQFPHELITYGGNGSVFQNWAQYHVTMQYLSALVESQTLTMYSGHPMGLYPSHPLAPKVVISNGMVIPNYATREEYDRMYAMGVTQYGQMTAGSYCYIGPQGIVHGTALTVLNAGRKYLGVESLRGKVFVSSGLGGMSGAQPKAAVIAEAISVIAEVDKRAIDKRHAQGWVMEVIDNVDQCIARIKTARVEAKPLSIAFYGNIVTLWERLAQESELLVDLGSDQTSLHNPYNGGYYPVQCSFEEANQLMISDPARFKELVQESIRRHVTAINSLANKGMKFWDYGNSFLYEAVNAGADIHKSATELKYPSYVEDIMADIFSLGFGPFRWVCTSCDPADLRLTDQAAAAICQELSARRADTPSGRQYKDNWLWVTQAEQHQLVVGSQARILYSDVVGRIRMAVQFNEMVRDGVLQSPVVISRDHHDVSGTDSPWRETCDMRALDHSHYCADMATHNFVGDALRGADWVALHNGGGTGWGNAINGGFGLVLDGSESARQRAVTLLFWDVLNGVSRRAWAGNKNALWAIIDAMTHYAHPNLIADLKSQGVDLNQLRVTLPNLAEQDVLDELFKD